MRSYNCKLKQYLRINTFYAWTQTLSETSALGNDETHDCDPWAAVYALGFYAMHELA